MGDGTLVVADYGKAIRRIGLDGVLRTVTVRGDLGFVMSLAVLPDGSLMVAGAGKVRRVAADGTVLTVARVVADDLASLPGGGVLAAERFAHVVRRVDADGRVSRFAGTGRYGSSGDGGPAIGARLYEPSGVASMPDGSVLIADFENDRVRRVDGNGVITTAARVREPEDVAARPDGGFYVSFRNGIKEFAADGSLVRVLSTVTPDFARRTLPPEKLAVLPDGNLAFTSFGDDPITYSRGPRVWLLRLAPTANAAVALRNLHVSADAVAVTIEATVSGTVTVRAGGRQTPLATTIAPVAAGITTLTLTGSFSPSGRVVHVELQDAIGRIATDRITAWLGRKLPKRTALDIADTDLEADSGGGSYIDRCKRYSRRRIDCEIRWALTNPYTGASLRDRCTSIRSVTLPSTGIPLVRSYRCRTGPSPFEPRPS
jgi:hypothetical protein